MNGNCISGEQGNVTLPFAYWEEPSRKSLSATVMFFTTAARGDTLQERRKVFSKDCCFPYRVFEEPGSLLPPPQAN
jgi:hypothetical protein